ncbi:MAG: hypothetical protein ACREDT_04820 [Methylocella sp.]
MERTQFLTTVKKKVTAHTYLKAIRERRREITVCGEMEMSERDRHQQEVDRNYQEFQKMLPNLLAAYRDKHALMKDGKILGYYSTPQDAAVAAQTFIPDGVFSIQEVTDRAINLGFFTHAVPVDTVQS